ncbi:cell separation during budding [Balamuthia mandrillaris]
MENATGSNVIPVEYSLKDTIGLALSRTPVSAIPLEKQQVVWVNSRSTVGEVLALLSQHRILSCPVWEPSSNQCLGFVSMIDMVALLLTLAEHLGPSFARSPPQGRDVSVEEEVRLEEQRRLWRTQQARNVVDLSRRNPIVPLEYDSSLKDAIQLLVQGIHQVPVLTRNRDGIQSILSQFLLVKYFSEHMDMFGDKPKLTVQQIMESWSKPVVSIEEDERVIDALRMIRDMYVSAVAVVDHQKRIVGVISASDMPNLAPDAGLNHLLYTSCKDFIKRARSSNQLVVPKVVSCTPTETLGMVVQKAVDNRVHRVFVVTSHSGLSKDILIGILSLRDILLELAC